MRAGTKTYRIGAGLSTRDAAADAAAEAAAAARSTLGGAEPDLAFLFLSAAHLDDVDAAVDALHEELAPRRVLGCVAEGVIGGPRELERGPALSVWAGSLPGAEIDCFHAVAFALEDGLGIAGFPELDDPALVAFLVDPFTFPTGPFLRALADQHGAVPVVGGIASGGGAPETQALVLDDQVLTEGAVGAVISGVRVRTLVSQGCSPIGRDAVITSAEENVVYELAGETALERLREELGALSAEQQQLVARGGLLAGLVIDENRSEYRRGDYLIRGLVGADEDSGALGIGEPVRVGQTLRFHVRDAASADEDLREGLEHALADVRSAGALLFTCNGRGRHMFAEPDHDARAISEALGGQALAGFFCGGEIGPVGGKPFLHGFTATLALFLDED